jgi:flagellar biosynthetic protein FliO
VSVTARLRLPAPRLLAALLGMIVALLPKAALAQEGSALDGVGGGVGGYDVGDWLGLGLRLGLVLVIVWGAVVAMRWYVRRTSGVSGGGGGRQLQVLETRALGPNRSLHLVRLGGRAVLLGVTPERITQLLEIDDPDEVERLSVAITQADPRPGSLRAIVGGLGHTIARLRPTDALHAARAQAAEATNYGPAGASQPSGAGDADGHRQERLAEIRRAIARVRQEVAQ